MFMAKQPTIRHSVVLPIALAQEIQRLFMEKNGSAHGAMQEALLRGAELVVQESRGGSAVIGAIPQAEGEFVKVPTHIREDIIQLIAELTPPGEMERFMRGFRSAKALLRNENDRADLGVVELEKKKGNG
jgi:hypothetical protein